MKENANDGVWLIAIPDNPRWVDEDKVSDVSGSLTDDPNHVHKWFEMDHYGEYGTGYAMCACGAVGYYNE